MSTTQSSHGETLHATKIIIGAVILILIAIAAFFLLRGQTTTTKTNNNEATVTSLNCTVNNIDNGVFSTSDALSAAYNISIIFYDDELSTLTYSYIGEYPSAEAATAAEPYIHGSFNNKLYSYGLSDNYFTSKNIQVDNDKVRLNVSADRNKITATSAPMLMLAVNQDAPEGRQVPTSLSDIKQNYSKQGFICQQKV